LATDIILQMFRLTLLLFILYYAILIYSLDECLYAKTLKKEV